MKSKYAINVYSEIRKLKTVLLHHRGEELLNLTPNLSIAQVEHHQFVKILIEHDVEVLYIEKLAAEVIIQDEKVRSYLIQLSDQQLINKIIAGVTKFELVIKNVHQYPLVIEPLPNLLFQRDPFVSVGNVIIISYMCSERWRRKILFVDLILKHHPRFKKQVNFWYDRSNKNTFAGGAILVLNVKNIIIGVSQRTSIETIKYCATKLINDSSNNFKKIIVLDLKTKNRAFIHLDTVFTNIDYDKFIVHAFIFDINNQFQIFKITKNGQKQVKQKLKDYLSSILNKPIKFIKCSGEQPMLQAREQWNAGNNFNNYSWCYYYLWS